MVYCFPLLARALVLWLNYHYALPCMCNSPQYIKNSGTEATVKKPKYDPITANSAPRKAASISYLARYTPPRNGLRLQPLQSTIFPRLRQWAAILGIWFVEMYLYPLHGNVVISLSYILWPSHPRQESSPYCWPLREGDALVFWASLAALGLSDGLSSCRSHVDSSTCPVVFSLYKRIFLGMFLSGGGLFMMQNIT